ncbi:MAG: hypothetical protein D3925_17840 [Candidatus Electrothrix sp. AR5]|nr:hypothetical protein [Candidatus Electrothrix sp. AR5]
MAAIWQSPVSKNHAFANNKFRLRSPDFSWGYATSEHFAYFLTESSGPNLLSWSWPVGIIRAVQIFQKSKLELGACLGMQNIRTPRDPPRGEVLKFVLALIFTSTISRRHFVLRNEIMGKTTAIFPLV